MGEPIPIPGKAGEPEVVIERISQEDYVRFVEEVTSGKGGVIGAGENLTAADLQGLKSIGRKFVFNLGRAMQEKEHAKKQNKGWGAVVVPLITAGIVTAFDVYKASKNKKPNRFTSP